jgi:hypothetical protein
MKIIERILNRYGYYKNPMTEAELALAYAESLGDVTDYKLSQEDEQRMFEDLNSVDNFSDYLRATSAKDIQRYFAAETDKQRDIVRGAVSRTLYFRGMLGRRKEIRDTKMKGNRYG